MKNSHKIFISYSHQDKEWETKLAKQLKVLAMEGFCDVWDDNRIQIGSNWKTDIEKALNEASVAILMISADFLISGFIRNDEIPTIMERRKSDGLTVIPVFIKPCAWRKIPWLAEIQGIPAGNKALSQLPEYDADDILANLAEKIHDMLNPCVKKEDKTVTTGKNGINKPLYETQLLTPLPPRTVHFIGREQDLIFLENKLKETERVLLMNGLGGIGKTELCKKFFYEHYTEYAYAAWIDYTGSIKESFVNTLGKKDAQGSIDEQFAGIRDFLTKSKEPFLLVIDNIENPEDEGLIQISRLPEHIKVLASSRMIIDGYECHTLDYLSAECCRDLFYQHFEGEKNKKNDEFVDEIVTLCGFHTLTVELIAKTGLNAALSLKELYDVLNKKGFNLGTVIDEKVKIHWHEVKDKKPIFEHLLKVFDLTGESRITESELHILTNLSVLPAVYIPVRTVSEWMKLETKDDINSLVAKGWLKRDKDHRVFMHNVIQDVIRYKTEPDVEECKDLIFSLEKETHLEHTGNPIKKKESVSFTDHVVTFVKGEDENLARLANNLSEMYWRMGQIGQALKFQLKAVNICEKALESDHPYLARSYNNVALIYKGMGQLDKALEFQLKALEIKEKVLSTDHPSLATSYHVLALIYKKMGKLDKALEFQLKDVVISKKVLGPDHPHLAKSYNNVSLIYKGMGQLEKAMESQLKDVEISEKVLSLDHPSLATSYHNLSTIYYDMNDISSALTYAEKAVTILQKCFPHSHPNLDIMKENLARIRKKMNSGS